MDRGESTTQISVTTDSKEAEVLCLLQTYWDEHNIRLSPPSTYALKIISMLSWKDRVATESKVLTEMLRSPADNGKKTALVSRGKSGENGGFSTAKTPTRVKANPQATRAKNCSLTDLRPSWFYPTTRQYPCKHLGYLDKKETSQLSPYRQWITLNFNGWKPLALKDSVVVPKGTKVFRNKTKLTVAPVGEERWMTTLKMAYVADYCGLNLRRQNIAVSCAS